VVVCHLQNKTKHDHVAFLVVVGADPSYSLKMSVSLNTDIS
jgi:cytochrome c